MSKLIEVKGIQYTESELERALTIEKFLFSQKFRDILVNGTYSEEDLNSFKKGAF